MMTKHDEAVLDVICGMYAPGGPLCKGNQMKFYLAFTIEDELKNNWHEVSREVYNAAARAAGVEISDTNWSSNRRGVKWQAGKVYYETERVQP